MIEKINSLQNWISNHKIGFFVLLFVAGLLLKLSFIFYWDTTQHFITYEHGMIAENIADGNGFTMYWPYAPATDERIELFESAPEVKSAFIPPLNPYLLSLFYVAFGVGNTANILYLILIAIISATTPILVYKTSKLLFNERVAIFSAIVYFIYLPAIYGVVTFSGSVIYHFFAISIIYFFAKIYYSNSTKFYIAVGILLSLQTLTRSEFLLLSFIMLLLSYIINRKRDKELSRTILAGSIFVLLISPWVIRNTLLFDKFVPIVSHPWHEIWRGSNEYSTGGSFAEGEVTNWLKKERFPELHSDLDSLEYDQSFELKADSIFKHYATEYWKTEQINSLYLSVKRTLILWAFDPFTPRAMSLAYLIPSVAVSLLFFISLFVLKKQKNTNWKPLLILFSFVIYYTLLIAVVNFEARYQVYMQSTIIIIVGTAIDYLLPKKLKL